MQRAELSDESSTFCRANQPSPFQNTDISLHRQPAGTSQGLNTVTEVQGRSCALVLPAVERFWRQRSFDDRWPACHQHCCHPDASYNGPSISAYATQLLFQSKALDREQSRENSITIPKDRLWMMLVIIQGVGCKLFLFMVREKTKQGRLDTRIFF